MKGVWLIVLIGAGILLVLYIAKQNQAVTGNQSLAGGTYAVQPSGTAGTIDSIISGAGTSLASILGPSSTVGAIAGATAAGAGGVSQSNVLDSYTSSGPVITDDTGYEVDYSPLTDEYGYDSDETLED